MQDFGFVFFWGGGMAELNTLVHYDNKKTPQGTASRFKLAKYEPSD